MDYTIKGVERILLQPDSWSQRYMNLARFVATWSKDPSTQVGAALIRPNKTIASVGFNGFPRGVIDTPERLNDRTEKYPRIVHAEMNAILNVLERPDGYTLYSTLAPCSQCAAAIIQSGVKSVLFPIGIPERWGESADFGFSMFKEAGVQCYVCEEVTDGS